MNACKKHFGLNFYVTTKQKHTSVASERRFNDSKLFIETDRLTTQQKLINATDAEHIL